jgi:hypothetical protein
MPSMSGDADAADRRKVDPYRHVFASALFDSKRGTVGDVERAMARGIFIWWQRSECPYIEGTRRSEAHLLSLARLFDNAR